MPFFAAIRKASLATPARAGDSAAIPHRDRLPRPALPGIPQPSPQAGPSTLVVANGLASAPVSVTVSG